MHFNKRAIFTAVSKDSQDLLKEWREHPDSLTDKLQNAKGSADLCVLFQNWTKPTWWDTFLLDIHDDLIFQREIIMKHEGIAYWYARSVIPQQCYALDPSFFKRLENESIRNLIFNEPRVSRLNMITYPIDEHTLEHYWIKKYLPLIQGLLWVRLAEFSFQQSELFYLIEILLPQLEEVVC